MPTGRACQDVAAETPKPRVGGKSIVELGAARAQAPGYVSILPNFAKLAKLLS